MREVGGFFMFDRAIKTSQFNILLLILYKKQESILLLSKLINGLPL